MSDEERLHQNCTCCRHWRVFETTSEMDTYDEADEERPAKGPWRARRRGEVLLLSEHRPT